MIIHTRPIGHSVNKGRKAAGSLNRTPMHSNVPTYFSPPQAVYLYMPSTYELFTTQTGPIPGYMADPRFGRKVIKNTLNTQTVTD